jgi:hypothetical protein
LGWLIATGTLAWAQLYGWGQELKQRLLGPQPNRATAFLHRSALVFFSLSLKAAQAIASRWKE